MTNVHPGEDSSRFVAARAERIPSSGIRRFFDLLNTMDDVISLGVGEPDFVTPEPIRKAAIASLERGETHYTSNWGTLELREALAAHLERLYGVQYDPHTEVLITVGVSEALDLAVRATTDPGDQVLCPEPSYVAYMPAITLSGGEFVAIPTTAQNAFKPRPADIEAHLTHKSRSLLLGYPNNPTGTTLSRHDLEWLADIARRHDLLVIADDIYARLTYDGEHACAAALPGMRERTILLGGFSKAFAMTGWRVGYACAPAPIAEAMMKVHQYTMMCASTMGQAAALEALRVGEPFVQQMVREYDRRRRAIVAGLNELGLVCVEPKGAFYAFPSVKVTGMEDEAFAEVLLKEERVAVVPGSAFGPSGRGHVRCCYATDMAKLEEALERLGRFVARHAAR
jgi:aminotransferase